MRSHSMRWAAAAALAGALAAPMAGAQEGAKALPTLLIKGEVVSVDTSDPAASLLKVKDRYGFETPIYLTQDTQVVQGDQALAASNLSAGTAVEVEYNFDINTAKRHAVRVSLSGAPAQAASAPAAGTTAETAAVEPPAAAPAPAADVSAEAPAAAPSETAPAAATTADTSQDQSGASVQ